MHNLHLLILKADSPVDACNEAENFITDFGNEGIICGCVSEDNEVFINDATGRYSPIDNKTTTIKTINKMVDNWIRENGCFFGHFLFEKMKKNKGCLNINRMTTNELFNLQQLAKHLHEVKSFKNGDKKRKFDVLNHEHEFFSYCYNECGVTQTGLEGEKTYVIFLDIHS